MYKKSRKKSAILFAGIFVVLGMWMMLSVHCWAADEYYGAAEPPVRCGESHLSGLTEPPHFVY